MKMWTVPQNNISQKYWPTREKSSTEGFFSSNKKYVFLAISFLIVYLFTKFGCCGPQHLKFVISIWNTWFWFLWYFSKLKKNDCRGFSCVKNTFLGMFYSLSFAFLIDLLFIGIIKGSHILESRTVLEKIE